MSSGRLGIATCWSIILIPAAVTQPLQGPTREVRNAGWSNLFRKRGKEQNDHYFLDQLLVNSPAGRQTNIYNLQPHSLAYNFSYDTGWSRWGRSYRFEERDEFGNIKGEYGWMAARGAPAHVTRYTADMHGYRSRSTIRNVNSVERAGDEEGSESRREPVAIDSQPSKISATDATSTPGSHPPVSKSLPSGQQLFQTSTMSQPSITTAKSTDLVTTVTDIQQTVTEELPTSGLPSREEVVIPQLPDMPQQGPEDLDLKPSEFLAMQLEVVSKLPRTDISEVASSSPRGSNDIPEVPTKSSPRGVATHLENSSRPPIVTTTLEETTALIEVKTALPELTTTLPAVTTILPEMETKIPVEETSSAIVAVQNSLKDVATTSSSRLAPHGLIGDKLESENEVIDLSEPWHPGLLIVGPIPPFLKQDHLARNPEAILSSGPTREEILQTGVNYQPASRLIS